MAKRRRNRKGQFARAKVVVPSARPGEGQRLVELRRSGAAGLHGDRRLKRTGTRSQVRNRSIDDSRG